jgi:hypothetical protein
MIPLQYDIKKTSQITGITEGWIISLAEDF